jgi:hypothetical protein
LPSEETTPPVMKMNRVMEPHYRSCGTARQAPSPVLASGMRILRAKLDREDRRGLRQSGQV